MAAHDSSKVEVRVQVPLIAPDFINKENAIGLMPTDVNKERGKSPKHQLILI